MQNEFNLKLFKPGEKQDIAALGGCAETVHCFEEHEAWAIMSAMYANRPLLLRGEPGTGKTQLAQAAAHVLGRNLVTTVVQSRTEWQDLLWQIDPIERLSMAHVVNENDALASEKLNPKNFLTPGPLWYALNWNSAKDKCSKYPAWVPPPTPEHWKPEKGVVMLIDEIDKAEPELANALLEVFGQGAFKVSCLTEEIRANDENPKPLVIITTNEERELQRAFLRRCLVLQLGLPSSEPALIKHLCDRGLLHFPKLGLNVREEAAKQLVKDRREAKDSGQPKPGQAEYLDLLRVLERLQEEGANPEEWLARICPYTFQKGPEAKQKHGNASNE